MKLVVLVQTSHFEDSWSRAKGWTGIWKNCVLGLACHLLVWVRHFISVLSYFLFKLRGPIENGISFYLTNEFSQIYCPMSVSLPTSACLCHSYTPTPMFTRIHTTLTTHARRHIQNGGVIGNLWKKLQESWKQRYCCEMGALAHPSPHFRLHLASLT